MRRVTSVLILQDALTEYRRPVFDALAAYYEITVLHAGRPARRPGDRYQEIIMPQRPLGSFHWQQLSSIRALQEQFDVIIAMFDLRWPAYLQPLLRRRRPKYILWGHRYSANSVANALRNRCMKGADRLLMYGEEEVERMIELGIDPAKIVTAPNTLHVPNHRDYSGSPKNSLLFVGRLQTRKRIDLIIESFARLQSQIADDVVIDVVGAGDLDAQLRQRAECLGITGKVNFHGQIDDHERLAPLFARAYCYVSPGPVGLGVLHSFAHGVPVLTLRQGRHGPEFHNLAHGRNALIAESLVDLDDAARVLCNDSCLARELGHNAYTLYAGERTLEHMIAGFREAIEN